MVSATDSDVGLNAQISYSLSSEISNEAVTHHEQEFVINAQTGAITTNRLLDRETMSGKYNYVDSCKMKQQATSNIQ